MAEYLPKPGVKRCSWALGKTIPFIPDLDRGLWKETKKDGAEYKNA